MDIKLDKLPLPSLVERAQRGEIALPQFQRNFVWPREGVADLLMSVLKNHYIGSFLLMRTDPDNCPFAIRPLAGVNVGNGALRPEFLILDGQQRLTSLHYALAAPDIPLKFTKRPYRFFLDMKKLLDGDDTNLIFSLRFDQCGDLLTEEGQFSRMVLPFTQLQSWSNWKDRYEDWLHDTNRDEYNLYREQRRPIWNQTIEIVSRFLVPYIELPKVAEGDEDGIAEVCAIFEKLNSTGVLLSVYDLLTARLYKDNIDQHQLWEDAVASHPQLQEFSGGETDVYGIFVLRTIALLRGLEVKSRSLVNLKPANFVQDWDRAVDAIEQALERLISIHADGFGVFDARWQPYSTLVPVLATALTKAEERGLGNNAYADIKCWYWGSVLLERYASAVESTTHRDASDLLKRQIDPNHRPQVFDDIKRLILDSPTYTLRSVARLNSVYRSIMNLVAITGAKDFATNDGIPFHELEDHHIFPRAFLRDRYGIKGDEVNTILNRTLIKDSTNRTISRKSPSEYLRDVFPAAHKEEILRSHLIGPEAQQAMENDDYEAFLVAREKDILTRLKQYLEPAR